MREVTIIIWDKGTSDNCTIKRLKAIAACSGRWSPGLNACITSLGLAQARILTHETKREDAARKQQNKNCGGHLCHIQDSGVDVSLERWRWTSLCTMTSQSDSDRLISQKCMSFSNLGNAHIQTKTEARGKDRDRRENKSTDGRARD